MKTYAKAILAGLIGFVGSLATATVQDNAVTLGEWLAAAAVGLTALGGVYGITNAPPQED